LLIVVIEIGPVLSKLIMNVGPYDLALAKTELTQMASSENEMRRDKQLLFDKQEGLYKKKKELSDEMIEKLTAMQSKHMNEEIEQWERGERSVNNKRALNDLAKKLKEQYDFEEENVI